MLLLPLLDLGMTGIFILITRRVEVVSFAFANLLVFGATTAIAAWWAYRPIAQFEAAAAHGATAARCIQKLPVRSAQIAAALVLVFSFSASTLGVYTPADANLAAFSQQEIAAALLFYAAMYAALYSYFTYFVVNDLCIQMRRHWRDQLSFSLPRGAPGEAHAGNPWRGGLARRLGSIFFVTGVLPALLLGMDLTLLAPTRALQGLSTADVVALDLLASLYVILASVYFVSRSLLAPTRELFDAHEAVRLGNLDHRAAVLTNDELGEVATRFNTMVSALRERELMKSALQRYLSPGVASELIASGGMIASRSVEATVMFTDIDGFTTLSETLTPQETVELLNAYFSLVNMLIQREGGIVNNFVGDAVVAIFNVPTEIADHAHAAVRAALALQGVLSQHQFSLPGGRQVTLPTRIGINTGPVCAGSIGSDERQGYTVYGDAVNLAARIEPMNKVYSTRILVSRSTRDRATEQGCTSSFTALDSVHVAGRSEPVMLYTVAASADLP